MSPFILEVLNLAGKEKSRMSPFIIYLLLSTT
jgi:hypothetical protein